MAFRSAPESRISPPAVVASIERVAAALTAANPAHSNYVTDVIAAILKLAGETGASDVHFKPMEDVMQVQWRVDGVLQPVAVIPKPLAPNVIARLKVLANLLTYRTDIPQEGRFQDTSTSVSERYSPSEMRLSTFPTLHGEKGVVRIFAMSGRFQYPQDLELPGDVLSAMLALLQETAGALLITGPAGSGKTTTAYACVRELQRQSGQGKSIVSIEDPVETVVNGVSQSQVNAAAGFDYPTALRSLLRQDPDAMLVGEIRDRDTAENVFQACLTGHLVLTTFHAGSAAEAVCRLNDMGIESYLLRAGLRAILSQRLFRRLCECSRWSDDDVDKLGYDVERSKVAVGCPVCDGTGYKGRFLLTELLIPDDPRISRSILNQSDAADLNRIAVESGMRTLSERTLTAVRDGMISAAEARRVLGFRSNLPHETARSPQA